jgi:hypothetical protein
MSGWNFYHAAKAYLGNGGLVLDGCVLSLFSDTSNAADLTLVTLGSATNEVGNGGYHTAVVDLRLEETAAAVLVAGNPVRWQAAGGAMTAVQHAVISLGDGRLLAIATLSARVRGPRG